MIDQQLIDRTAAHACRQIKENLIKTSIPGLWKVENFLTDDFLKKLQSYLIDLDESRWCLEKNVEYRARRKINWDPDTVIEELHEVCNTLTPLIRVINPVAQNFWGISIWKDSPGYTMSWHTDNTDIDAALQIYLFGSNDNPGTEFKNNNAIEKIEFNSNNGYLVNQTDFRPIHRIAGTVKKNQTRYSLYAVWSRHSKHIADTP